MSRFSSSVSTSQLLNWPARMYELLLAACFVTIAALRTPATRMKFRGPAPDRDDTAASAKGVKRNAPPSSPVPTNTKRLKALLPPKASPKTKQAQPPPNTFPCACAGCLACGKLCTFFVSGRDTMCEVCALVKARIGKCSCSSCEFCTGSCTNPHQKDSLFCRKCERSRAQKTNVHYAQENKILCTFNFYWQNNSCYLQSALRLLCIMPDYKDFW